MSNTKHNDLLATVAERLRMAEAAHDAARAQLTLAEAMVHDAKNELTRRAQDAAAHKADLVAVATTGECDRLFGFARHASSRARDEAEAGVVR